LDGLSQKTAPNSRKLGQRNLTLFRKGARKGEAFTAELVVWGPEENVGGHLGGVTREAGKVKRGPIMTCVSFDRGEITVENFLM